MVLMPTMVDIIFSNFNVFNMEKESLLIPSYDQDSNPVDYTDENGTRWIYEGRVNDVVVQWSGIPREDKW